jgi:ribosomal protein S27AE
MSKGIYVGGYAKPTKIKTPKCPACGAKFAHNEETLQCKNCGLPDEIISLGPRMIARWKSKNGIARPRRVSTSNRRVRKHGR